MKSRRCLSCPQIRGRKPEISWLLGLQHKAVLAYAAEHGLPVKAQIARPRLSERMWVSIVGGGKLPSFPDSKGDCTIDLKISPMARLNKELDKELRAKGSKPSVTLLGTRFDESKKRASKMMGRGDGIDVINTSNVGGHAALTMTPICDFPTETIWAYLNNAGSDPNKLYPGYGPNFRALHEVYDSANGGECVLYLDPNVTNRSKGCDSRTGCHSCQKIKVDSSMLNMLKLDEYQYMAGLSRFRQYIAATRWDWSKRRWSRVDHKTGDIIVGPNNYSGAFAQDLLRMLLTLDKREAQRAANVSDAIDNGELPITPRNLRMAKPQFQNISLIDLIAIDYLWSINVVAAPHRALEIAQEVTLGTGEMDVPVAEETPKTPIPVGFRIPARKAIWEKARGIHDAELEMNLFDGEGITYREGEKGPVAIPCWNDTSYFDIDEEAAYLFFEFEMADRIRYVKGTPAHLSTGAARYYHRLGLVSYSHDRAYLVERQFKRSDYLLMLGYGNGEKLEAPADAVFDELPTVQGSLF